ncbi:MAG: hypothetical protein ACLQM8_11210 [Limisphaerales bacterium]
MSEDAVKQRLSRRRKFLQEQFMACVAGAPGQTRPGNTTPAGRDGQSGYGWDGASLDFHGEEFT